MDRIGKHLRELRKKEELSIRALAEKVGISYNTIASYERDKIVPTINNVMKICDYFKVPAEYLIHGKKILTDFNDTELLTLFREVDEYENKDREVVKELLRKITGNIKERREIFENI